jgi:hypothetical protein
MIFGLDELTSLKSSIFFFSSIHLIPVTLVLDLDCSLIR